MIIYRLQNFIKDNYLFTENGEYILDYSFSLSDTNFIKNAKIHYKSNPTETITTPVNIKTIDFNTFPLEIQGLFQVYKLQISSVKASLTDKQWKELLALHSKNV